MDEQAVGVRDLLASWERGPGPSPRWLNALRASWKVTEEATYANTREAVAASLAEHRAPVYGGCGCGWQVPGYPYSNGSAHWRQHMSGVIADRALRPGQATS